jgi:signal transduction histidine kinase
MFTNDAGIIIWKKTNSYYCIHSNCDIKQGCKLKSYLDTSNYSTHYLDIIDSHNDQVINFNNQKIILKHIPDDIILELRIKNNINLHLLLSLSHKIRNPLSDIHGILTLLEKSKLGKSEQQYLSILKKSCYDIMSVTNDIIDIVNSNTGDLKLNNTHVVLTTLLQDCQDIVINSMNEKKLIMKIIIDKDLPTAILSDSIKLKQIIINMLLNSIQNTNIGGIEINVLMFKKNGFNCPFDFIPCDKPKYNILFVIKDSGSGMEITKKNFVKSILGLDQDKSNIYDYGGLGLIISKYICNMMGGNIWFKPNVIGTVFYFNIIVDAA